jgi:cell division protein YceG involved in septum cleavage
MEINAKHKQLIKIKDTNLEEVEEFIYLGSIVNIEGGTDADVKNRINKARVIFNILEGCFFLHLVLNTGDEDYIVCEI